MFFLPFRQVQMACRKRLGVWFLSYAIWLGSRESLKLFDFSSQGLMSFICCPFSICSIDWFCSCRLISMRSYLFPRLGTYQTFKNKKSLLCCVAYECPHLSIWWTASFPVAGVIYSVSIACICLVSPGLILFCLAPSLLFPTLFCKVLCKQ